MIKLGFLKKYLSVEKLELIVIYPIQYENRLIQVRHKYLPWIAKGKKNAGTRSPNLA